MKFPKGPEIMMIVAMIMIIPCSPTMALYCVGLKSFDPGRARFVRMSIASRPPTPKRTMARTRYWMPTTL